MRISLVIPCYNEEKNIPYLLEACEELIENNFEIIIVDNGSTDQTAGVIKNLKNKYKKCKFIKIKKNLGYGNGILTGLKNASGDLIGWTHADLQTSPSDAIHAQRLFKKHGNDIFVKGTRQGRSFIDNFFSYGMSFISSLLLHHLFFEINAQPTFFSKNFFKELKNPPKDFSLDLYAYFMAKRKKLKIYRFDVYFGKRLHGYSSWNNGIIAKYKFIIRNFKNIILISKDYRK